MTIHYLAGLLLVIPLSVFAQATNPYMEQIKINMHQCIQSTMNDCLKSICLASPDSCRSQCATNATHKCNQLAGQTLYQE